MHLTRLKSHKHVPCAILLFTKLVAAQVVVTPSEPAVRTQEAHLQILRNMGRLNVEFGLDRSVYFPNKNPEVTVRIPNPPSPLDVSNLRNAYTIDVSHKLADETV